MKKLVCFVVFTLLLGSVCAQRIIINEIDKFTGDSIIETSVVKTSRTYVDYKLRRVNDSLFLYALISNVKDIVDVDETVSIAFLTKRGDIIELSGNIVNSNIKEKGHTIHWGAGISTGGVKKMTNVNVQFDLPIDKLQLLQSDIITDIRFNLCHKNIDFLVDGFTQKRLKKLFNLIK